MIAARGWQARMTSGVSAVAPLFAGDQEPEVRTVGSQDDAVAVDDQSARRRHELEVELVGGRQRLVALCLDELLCCHACNLQVSCCERNIFYESCKSGVAG